MENLKLGRSRMKTFLLLLGAIGFVLGGLWMLQSPDTDLFEKIAGVVGVLFFGAAIPIGIKKLYTNEMALELSKDYLIIEPSSSNKYVLPWRHISGFEVIKIKGTKIITIKVDHPQDWINKESSLIKRKLMQFNLSNYGTPFNISASGLEISHHKLLELLNRFHKAGKS